MTTTATELSINTDRGVISAIHLRPRRSAALFVCAHGAGAPMRHRFLEALAPALAARDVATLRFNFPFTEAGRRFPPDRAEVCIDVVRAAVARGVELAGGVPVFAGGKSMGGRMTSLAHAASPLPGVGGLIFLGFPLRDPARGRADHLAAVDLPMLMIQGDRDELADLGAVRDLVERLGPRASLHVVDHADHGFEVLVRSGRTAADVIGEIAVAAAGWIGQFDQPRGGGPAATSG